MSDQEVVDAEVVGEDQQNNGTMEVAPTSSAIATRGEMSVEDVIAQARKVQQIAEQAMVEGDHYGTIPGTDKPTLLKPGAEKLCLTFRLDPEYEAQETFHDDGHYTVTSTCTVFFVPTGTRVASGMGSCSTRESKYAYRKAQRVCPSCGGEAIIKSKAEYGGGWLCWKKRDGCGAKFSDGDEAIESQEAGRVPNPDLGDLYNTVLKMANKRALVAAVLNGTAASDIFTQDIGDPEAGNGGSAGAGPDDGETLADVQRHGPEECTDETWDAIKAASADLTDDGKAQVKEWCAEHGWTLKGSELSEPQARQVLRKIEQVAREASPAEASSGDKPHEPEGGEGSEAGPGTSPPDGASDDSGGSDGDTTVPSGPPPVDPADDPVDGQDFAMLQPAFKRSGLADQKERYRFIEAFTHGRAKATRQLRKGDVSPLRDALKRFEAGEVELVDGDDGPRLVDTLSGEVEGRGDGDA